MDVKSRIRCIKLLEKMENQKEFCKEAGIVDVSRLGERKSEKKGESHA